MNDLLVAFAMSCPFVAVTILFTRDVSRWLHGGEPIGVGRDALLGATATAGTDASFDGAA